MASAHDTSKRSAQESQDEAGTRTGDPFAEAADSAFNLLQGRWTMRIVFQLLRRSPMRFTELQHAVTGIGRSALVRQLKDLEALGIVTRVENQDVPRRVEYGLTVLGKALRPALRELVYWAKLRNSKQSPKPVALLREGSFFR